MAGIVPRRKRNGRRLAEHHNHHTTKELKSLFDSQSNRSLEEGRRNEIEARSTLRRRNQSETTTSTAVVRIKCANTKHYDQSRKRRRNRKQQLRNVQQFRELSLHSFDCLVINFLFFARRVVLVLCKSCRIHRASITRKYERFRKYDKG